SITITQSIELGGKRGARIGVADANRSMVDADLDLRRQGLRADVIQAFFAALRAQEGMRLAEASLSLAERAAKVADQLQSPSRSSWAASAALESAWRMLIARWWMPIST
ncbi:TolC family protein, partial [Acinetobacter baumannii]|uniref:TolC family protein n=1 Tax=Acinetobacter baumannii TaxID=470 RepID=UPI001D176B19